MSAVSIGSNSVAAGDHSTAIGFGAKASDRYSVAIGTFLTASAYYSLAMGVSNYATGISSTAMGSDYFSTGDYTTVLGYNNTARSFCSTTIGQYNDSISTSSPTTWVDTDPLFIIGNGTADNARSNAITILKNAKTGINTEAPKAMLHVVKAGTSGGAFLSSASLVVEDNVSSFIQLSNPTATENGIISSSTIAPVRSALVFSADSGMSFRAGGNIERMKLSKTGNLQIDGVLTQSSDMRFKTNIALLSNSLPLLMKVNGYTYNWKNETSDAQLQTGVLAQEVEKVLPQLVHTASDGTKSVNYIGLVPHLLEALKEQQKQIDAMEKRLERLEKKKNDLSDSD